MKWPWVSRVRLDEYFARCIDLRDRGIASETRELALAADLRAERERYETAASTAAAALADVASLRAESKGWERSSETWMAEAAESRRALTAEVARHSDLLDKYHALKLAGAVIPEPAPVLPERKRDALLEAINAKAGRNGLLRDRMMAQLRKDRQMIATGQMTEADVLARIEQGESPAEEALPI